MKLSDPHRTPVADPQSRRLAVDSSNPHPMTRYLGDLKEATDFELLNDRHITAVLNLINWWELSSRLPEAPDARSRGVSAVS